MVGVTGAFTRPQRTLTGIQNSKPCLLASTALASGVLISFAVNPPSALAAACVGQNTAVVICNNVTTNNVAERQTTNSTPTTVTIGPGFLNGFGLAATQAIGGTTLNVTNTGTVTLDNPGASLSSLPVLQLTGDGGAITYTGSGSITNTAATPTSTGLQVTNAPGGDISISTSGPITGFVGISATSGTPLNGLTESGNITITNTSIVTGTGNSAILTHSEAGTTTITNSGTLNGGFAGVEAFGGPGSITVTNTGNVNGAFFGIHIDTAALNSGAITINSTGNITGAAAEGILVIQDVGPTSIHAHNVFGGSEGITVSSNGSVSVETTGTIRGVIEWGIAVDTPGSINVNVLSGSVTGVGEWSIFARGGSDISIAVNSGATVSGNPTETWGIEALHSGGNGSTNITVNGSVLDGGIKSTVLGSGLNTVTVGGSVVNTVGQGIFASAVNGATNITNSGTVTGFLAGIEAASTAGAITVTNSGSVSATGAEAAGVLVQTESGTALVNSTGTVTGSRGIDVRSASGPIGIHANNVAATSGDGILGRSTTGAVSIETTGTINAFSNGITASSGTGSIDVNVLGGSITAGAAGILTTAVNGPTNIANFAIVTGSLAGILATGLGTGSVTVANAGSVSATGPDAAGVFV